MMKASVTAVVMTVACVGVVLGQPAPSTPAVTAAGGIKAAMGRGRLIDSMENLTLHVTDLLGDQNEKLEADYDARTEELADILNRARGSLGEGATKEQIRDSVAKTTAARAQVLEAHALSVRAILTPAQALEWETWKLRQQAAQRFSNVSLSVEQNEKINAAAEAAAKEIVATKDAAASIAAQGRFWKGVASTILTDEQAQHIFGIEGMGSVVVGGDKSK